MGEFDSSEVHELALDFSQVPLRATNRVRGVVKDAARDVRDKWRSNARATARRHGKHYPRSITDEAVGGLGLDYDVGPESAMPQGGMGRGFEFGSVNQPPHLDGSRAADATFPGFAGRVAAVVEGVFR